MRNAELWQRLVAFEFDGAGSAPYSVKLARAEGWNAGFTARVIEEYRRFLYLTQVSARQVTPSQIVDAAWHMHLTFTRDYWEDLCPNVIGKSVHHQPCAGEEEMPRYRDQFAATKALYEAEFGAEPPADIWGRDALPKRRFLRGFVRSEVGSAGPAPQLLLALALAILATYLWVSDATIAFAVVSVAAVWFVLAGLVRMGRIKGDIQRRRKRGDTGAGDGGWWFSYESDDPNFDSGGGMFGGGGDGGDSDGGGCGGCGGD